MSCFFIDLTGFYAVIKPLEAEAPSSFPIHLCGFYVTGNSKRQVLQINGVQEYLILKKLEILITAKS